MNDNLKNELKAIEKCFQENGYTQEMIKEIKNKNGAVTLIDFIDNLQEERSCWNC